MAVTLTGTSSGAQGLFNRLGVMGGRLVAHDTARAAIETAAATVLALFDGAGTPIRNTVDGLTNDAYQQTAQMGSWPAGLASDAAAVLIRMFDDDQPLPTRSVDYALAALEKQMLTATTSYVDPNTVAATVTQTSLTGNGVVVTSVKDGRGRNLENLLAERITLTCTDNTVSGSETIQALGEAEESDRLSHRWPRGSGSDETYTSVSPSGTDNLVPSGAFDTTDFTTNVPTGWSVIVGVAGTDIDDDTANEFAGDGCLKLVGDSATLSQLRVPITGLSSLTPYALNFWIKADVVPAAGALVVDLYDGSSVIADEATTNNTLSVDLTAITTGYVAKNVVFRLPEPVPAAVYLRIRLSTAVSTGSVIFIDSMAMVEMQQPSRDAGRVPYIAVFSGSTGWSTDDGNPNLTNTFKIECTNDRASDWQKLFDRFFDTGADGFILPSAGTTLINDSLIA